VSELARKTASRAQEALRREIHQGERYKPFGELTLAEVREREAAMQELRGWGPMQRVGPVAKAWAALAALMEERGATRVRELEPEEVADFAERLWVIAPEEGLI
jgi:hypothetical protein